MSERPLTWKRDPHPTRIELPKDASDCHCHVFGPINRFPYSEGSSYRPADAPKEALFDLHDRMGIERCVIVQSAVHGHDNRVVIDAMKARPGRYLGIALAPADVDDATLDDLAGQGFRGIRFNYMAHLEPGASDDQLRQLAPRLAQRGMHLQVHMEADLIAQLAPILSQLPVEVVIDHIGRVDASKGLEQGPFQTLLHLLDSPYIWCKVSGCERASRQTPPYADAVPFARAIVERFGDRVVWGTDWPHPNYRTDPPDDGDLFDLLHFIAPGTAALQALMVDNPTRLYRFGEN
ncbi:amidohydrolase [Notoacmeibacter sp. MSK16QG-6]|uniref:amidohydrolase family protein n=1 Tax=Notoacmeibacter sp. MSK16QG-6 TaxID=2957982 RepID=UPI00209EF06F|nr:amidohydrolase family protein [Notoacmeibacter sp. MSK16QG-6]MCP1200579.1 amidohydrolase family protein [Notoacmeibacter sp. MSK16QG-6]